MKWISIRDKFRLYVIFLLIIPIIILSTLLFSSESNKVTEITEREQYSNLRSIKEYNINITMNNIENILRNYSSDPRLINNNIDNYKEISKEWEIISKTNNMDIYFLDIDNNLVTNSEIIKNNNLEFKWEQNNSRNKEIKWFEPYDDLHNNLLTLAASIIIFNDSDEPIGTLAANINFNELFITLKNRAFKLDTNLVMVLNNGRVINLNRKINEPIYYGSVDVNSLEEGTFSKLKINNTKYHISTTYIDSLNLYLATLVLDSGLTSHVNRTLSLLLTITFITILFMLLGSFLISRGIIKNIMKINNYIENVSKGDFHIDNCITSNDEFLILNKMLNSLVEELSNCKERTNELLILRNNLINFINHNAFTPLTILFNNGMLLMQKYPEDHIISDMFYSSKDLKGLIEQLMVFLRVDRNNVKFNYEKVNIEDLTKLTLNMYNTTTVKKDIKVVCNIENGLFLEGSYFFIKVIIENLIDNAIKFSNINSAITINAKYKGNLLEWIISDSGPGINIDKKEKIFEEFKNISEKPIDYQSKIGHGLYIVKKIIDSIGGKMELIENELPGTSIRLLLPRKPIE